MKITISGKALAAVTALILVVGTVGFLKAKPLCQQSVQSANQRCANTQQNWFDWVKGDSRSAQFHFVDFLELLNRITPGTKSR